MPEGTRQARYWCATCATALLVAAFTGTAAAQKLDPRPTPTAPAPATDPLGRNTPRGTVTGFSVAVRRDDLATASRFLQLTPAHRRQVDSLARDLAALLDRYFTQSVTALSDSPQGIANDGLSLDRERVTLLIDGKAVDLLLVRVTEQDAGPIWLISSDTLAQVPALSRSLRQTWVHRYLPAGLAESSFLGVSVAQWVVWAASIILPLVVLWLISRIVITALRWSVGGVTQRALIDRWHGGLNRPLILAIGLGIHVACVPLFALTFTSRVVYTRFTSIAAVLILGWLVWRLLTLSFTQARMFAIGRRHASTESLMLLGERMAKAILLLAALFAFLKIGGVDTTTALAGVGIGGVAVALGAQRSVENFLGGVFLLTDKALAVGDLCCIADRTGWIEDITLRSVRVRTLEQTLLSIPAGLLAQATIENLTTRQKILMNTKLRLRYPATAAQLRSILDGIHETLAQHRDVEPASARVRLIEFRETGIELEVFAYVLTADFARFLIVREELLLQAASIVEAAGSGFAALQLPSAHVGAAAGIAGR